MPSAPDSAPKPRSSVPRFTLANALTTLRLFAAPVCAYLIFEARDVEAVAVYALAIATDFADGPLARRRGESSPAGGLFDHGTDATFVVLGIAALCCRGLAPVVLPPMIALAFIQYALDSKVLAGQELRTSFLGRWNGIFYYVVLGTPIIRNLLGWSWPGDDLVRGFGWLLVVSTGISMGDRLLALARVRGR